MTTKIRNKVIEIVFNTVTILIIALGAKLLELSPRLYGGGIIFGVIGGVYAYDYARNIIANQFDKKFIKEEKDEQEKEADKA